MTTPGAKPTLNLLKVGGNVEAQLAQMTALFRKLAGREPTPEEIAEARAILEAPDEEAPDDAEAGPVRT